MRPVLVTGGGGQLALALQAALAGAGVPVMLVGRPGFDFDRPDSVRAVFADVAPSIVVNAAAYTAVDAAEQDVAAATRANSDGPAMLAALAAASGATLLHVSTDYVFDGLKGGPYVETDPVAPQGVYGRTKRAGEAAVLASGARALVLRTSWVYSAGGRNFVRTMLNAARKTDRLRVVSDQQGCPTAAADLADAIRAILTRLQAGGWHDAFAGVYHACGSGSTTWHGLAVATFAAAARLGHASPTVEAIATADWPTPARRPPDSRLDCTKLAMQFGVRLPDWRGSLARTVEQIMQSTEQAGTRAARCRLRRYDAADRRRIKRAVSPSGRRDRPTGPRGDSTLHL